MVEVTRSNFTESVHHGVAVLINSSGEVLNCLLYTSPSPRDRG